MEILWTESPDPQLKGFIDYYYGLQSNGIEYAETVPNGRPDATLLLEGWLEWFNPRTKKYEKLPEYTMYPATNSTNLYRGDAKLLGVKFTPELYALRTVAVHLKDRILSFKTLFGQKLIADLQSNLRTAKTSSDSCNHLNEFFKSVLLNDVAWGWLLKTIALLKEDENISVDAVAARVGVTVKTLERRFKKNLGINPSQFISIYQLHRTFQMVRKLGSNHGAFTKSLSMQYHDQSHFIKSCKKITGLTPRKLFSRLPKQLTDLIINQSASVF